MARGRSEAALINDCVLCALAAGSAKIGVEYGAKTHGKPFRPVPPVGEAEDVQAFYVRCWFSLIEIDSLRGVSR